MRPVYLSDLHHAACALRGLASDAQATRIAGALAAAKTADRYREATGRGHPAFGSGTLSSAFGEVKEPPACDRAYLKAMQTVAAALRTHVKR